MIAKKKVPELWQLYFCGTQPVCYAKYVKEQKEKQIELVDKWTPMLTTVQEDDEYTSSLVDPLTDADNWDSV